MLLSCFYLHKYEDLFRPKWAFGKYKYTYYERVEYGTQAAQAVGYIPECQVHRGLKNAAFAQHDTTQHNTTQHNTNPQSPCSRNLNVQNVIATCIVV